MEKVYEDPTTQSSAVASTGNMKQTQLKLKVYTFLRTEQKKQVVAGRGFVKLDQWNALFLKL